MAGLVEAGEIDGRIREPRPPMPSDRSTFTRRVSPRQDQARRRSTGPRRGTCPADIPRGATRGEPPWWWRPRVRSVLLLSAMGVAVVCARLFAQVQTNWLWFHEVHQGRVFWTILAGKWLA